MLYHHSGQDYNVAASAAATAARAIMEKKIADGRAGAVRLLEHVNTAVPTDYVAKGHALNFLPSETGVDVELKTVNGAPFGLHRHAIAQIAARAKIPGAYLNDLIGAPEPWKKQLASDILNQHYGNPLRDKGSDVSNARHLIRVVGSVNGVPRIGAPADPQVRGFLSDRYRRLDSRPLLDAFAQSCSELGAIPVEGTVTDTRLALKAYLPMVFEPVPNEVLCIGVEWGNSDFGSAKHSLRAFIFRLWCSNGATLEDLLAQVHLGGRFAEEVEFSDRTYALDTKTSVSALRDTVRGALGPKAVNSVLEGIKNAHENKVEWKNVATKIGKRLLKDELKAARDAFESDDVINLPPVKSAWRASNAISWIAKSVEDDERRLELQKLAGALVTGKLEAEAEAA